MNFKYIVLYIAGLCVCMYVQLLDLQLSDSNFRRCILLQYLILFHYLNAQVRFKTLVPLACFTVSSSRCLCACLLSMYAVMQVTVPLMLLML